MDTEQIRGRTLTTLASMNISVNHHLPTLESTLELRTTQETTSRLLTMHVVSAVAHGFTRAKGIAYLEQENLTHELTEREKLFVFDSIGDVQKFMIQVEAIWALAWATGHIHHIDFTRDCDDNFVNVLPDIRWNEPGADFRARAKLRTIEEIAAVADLAYCLHWAIVNAALSKKKIAIKPYLVTERRHALEWLIGYESWDDITLDT